MKKIFLIIIVLMIVVGCGSSNTTNIMTCTIEDDQISAQETYTADNDQLVSYHAVINSVYSTATEEQLETYKSETQKYYDETLNTDDIDGFTVVVDISDNIDNAIKVTLDIDYTKADYSKLAKAGFLDSAESETISLEKTREGLIANGYDCQEK